MQLRYMQKTSKQNFVLAHALPVVSISSFLFTDSYNVIISDASDIVHKAVLILLLLLTRKYGSAFYVGIGQVKI